MIQLVFISAAWELNFLFSCLLLVSLHAVQRGERGLCCCSLWGVRVGPSDDHGSVCVGHHWDVQCPEQVRLHSMLFLPVRSTFCLVFSPPPSACLRTSPWCGCPPGATAGWWPPWRSPCLFTSWSSTWTPCLWVFCFTEWLRCIHHSHITDFWL